MYVAAVTFRLPELFSIGPECVPVLLPVRLPAKLVEVIVVQPLPTPPVNVPVPSVIVGAESVCPVSTVRLPSTLVTPSN